VAVNLPRDEDREAIPAWLGTTFGPDMWASVADAARLRSVAQLVEGGEPLGLAVAGVGELEAGRDGAGPVVAARVAGAPVVDDPPLVVDLSSLWAGPLCARLLHQRGARVIKVESWARPDGARRGPAAFFQLMQTGARFVGLDLAAPSGRHALAGLLARADVVIEASRPRALRQLGIDAASIMAEQGPRVWISITGYGRDRDRVAFGDDAAAAGGLLAWDEHGPCFAADAVADPLAGVAAAAAAAESLVAGGRWILDVAMAGVAAHVAGTDAGRCWHADRQPAPTVRLSTWPESQPLRPVGADNAAVAAELGIAIP
jgi:crotonobetainyl-CoA:carnitine CoA-transferase CaiB-like acyl-CoA transferase